MVEVVLGGATCPTRLAGALVQHARGGEGLARAFKHEQRGYALRNAGGACISQGAVASYQ